MMLTEAELELMEMLALATGRTDDVPVLVAEVRRLQDALKRAVPYVQTVWAMQYMRSDHELANRTSLLATARDDWPFIRRIVGE